MPLLKELKISHPDSSRNSAQNRCKEQAEVKQPVFMRRKRRAPQKWPGSDCHGGQEPVEDWLCTINLLLGSGWPFLDGCAAIFI
jgi:hypothetical protein